MVELNKTTGFEKIHTVIHMHDNIVALYAENSDIIKPSVNAAVDELLNFIVDNFTLPKEEDCFVDAAVLQEMSLLFDKDKLKRDIPVVARFRDIPPTLLDTVIPVAVMRSLMYVNKVRFSPAGMTGWNRFAVAFCNVILAA